MSANGNRVTLMAVGDVIPRGDEPEILFDLSLPVLRQADVLFGNCENPISETGSPNSIVPYMDVTGGGTPVPPKNAEILKRAGFHVMSFANNHHLDWGYEAFFNTLSVLQKQGIAPVGAGRNLAEARKPVIVEKNGTRIAFLAYAMATFRGYEATVDRPGAAKIRVYTFYRQVEDEQPGTAPETLTFADLDDKEAMREDIRNARRRADIVAVSFHWGLHFVPAKLTRYEPDVAHAAVDAGADIILGGHQHILKPVEVYKGKPIFYGMNNFAMGGARRHLNQGWKELYGRYKGLVGPQKDDPTYMYSPEARQTMIVRIEIERKRIVRASYIPCVINLKRQPEPLQAEDKRFGDALRYMKRISRSQGMRPKLSPDGNEIVLSLASRRSS